MGEAERVTIERVEVDHHGCGRVLLSNGMELGKVLGFEFEVTAGRHAELVLRVPAVSVHVGHHPLERAGADAPHHDAGAIDANDHTEHDRGVSIHTTSVDQYGGGVKSLDPPAV